jgi:OOP family OmpA-OmpF porin
VGIKFPVALTLSVLIMFPAVAQQEPVLHDDEITPDAVVKGLTPKKNIRTRNFTMKREGADTDEDVPSVSLLITFLTDSDRLTDKAKPLLDNVGSGLQDPALAKYRFEIIGHADTRGRADYNQRLSKKRADAVKAYLVRQGVDGDRLDTIGMGAKQPWDKEHPETPENRRVALKTIVHGSYLPNQHIKEIKR